MRLQDLLAPDAVRVLSAMSSKKRLFHALADIAEQAYGPSADLTAVAIMEREKLGPTGVGQGVALPHARHDAMSRVTGVFVKLERPMDYDAIDGRPVDLIFALFAPSDAGVDHLKALAAVSRTLRNPDLCATLRANDEVTALHAVLTERDATHAA